MSNAPPRRATRTDEAHGAAYRITLVRHGRSSHAVRGWVDRRALDAWFAAYDAAGLAPDDVPPADLRVQAERAGLVVTSDMPRALESAARLAPERDHVTSALLREAVLPIPSLPRFLPVRRLHVRAWGLITGLRWMRALRHEALDGPTPARARAREASDWLEELAHAHGSLLVVTHGVFRRYLAEALVARGWMEPRGRVRSGYWSCVELRREPGGA